MVIKKIIFAAVLFLLGTSLYSIGGQESSADGSSGEPGSIIFTANGEDFVRRGFVDKQGWHIVFDRLFVNIVNPTAYTSDGTIVHTFHGPHLIDLADGGEDADPIVIGVVESASPANYQSLRFSLNRIESGEFAGSSIVMIGKAEKNGRLVPFTIKLEEEMDFDGKEGFVGDEVKGLLLPGGTTTVEMTFHFDHIFGDIEAGSADHINTGSVGFDFFEKYRKNGAVDISQSHLSNDDDYKILLQALWTLGHLGEGHCDVSNQSSLDEI
jgi:hypothetical protein